MLSVYAESCVVEVCIVADPYMLLCMHISDFIRWSSIKTKN